MVITYANSIFKIPSILPHLPFKINNGRKIITISPSAKRTDSSASNTSTEEGNQPKFPSLRVPNPILARSFVSILGLGFIDAGYSGDWSRIGVITKEAEDLLKIAAFLVVPFCLFLIFSFFKENDP